MKIAEVVVEVEVAEATIDGTNSQKYLNKKGLITQPFFISLYSLRRDRIGLRIAALID